MATLLKMCKLQIFKVTSHRKYVFATTELALPTLNTRWHLKNITNALFKCIDRMSKTSPNSILMVPHQVGPFHCCVMQSHFFLGQLTKSRSKRNIQWKPIWLYTWKLRQYLYNCLLFSVSFPFFFPLFSFPYSIF